MASVNRWVIYCHFYGVAVNPRLSMSNRETQRRRFSVNMEQIPVTLMSSNRTRNGLFGIRATKKSSRKNTRDLPGRTEKAWDTLSGHGSAHFYTGVSPVSALCEAPAHRIRMR